MTNTQALSKVLDAALQFGGPEFYLGRVPDFIYQNLRPGFGKRAYQQEAFGRFVYYWNEFYNRPKGVPTQLLFHMATGSGKTLIMAGLILYLFDKGYRNFLFFVNSTNIIDKTRDNFLEPDSSKYLFAPSVDIQGKKIRIKEVDTFQGANPEDINLVFSTIQNLHVKLNSPSENALTYDDFEEQKIVLISDEAHHINAETKTGNGLTVEEEEEILSWERTVNRIFTANPENVLLEFTATVDLAHPDIAAKYVDKLIFDYSLRQFRKDGFSKEVKVLQADLQPIDRALQGIVLSQYRRKVFEKYGFDIKPVILFKSKTIKESQQILEQFTRTIKNLKASDLERIKKRTNGGPIGQCFRFMATNNVRLSNLVEELKEDFSEAKLLSVNSKEESELKQRAVNSLEKETNPYRAVFAVDKLNEGWDVLNLFDIVRLYDTRDSKDGRPGKTTMSEAQLIGRGARYCPFQIYPDQSPFSRKFDSDIAHELRICEELYYHSGYNPRYIQELNTALEEIGIKPRETKERSLRIKERFKKKLFYRKGVLFLNEQVPDPRKDAGGLFQRARDHVQRVRLSTGFSKSSLAFEAGATTELDLKSRDFKLVDFGIPIIRKAISKLEFYRFHNLKTFLPELKSISEFISSEEYLGTVKMEMSGLPAQLDNLGRDQMMEAAVETLSAISHLLESTGTGFRGTKEFLSYDSKTKKPHRISTIFQDKQLSFSFDGGEDREYGRSMNSEAESSIYLDLSKRDWHVFDDCFGTSEEKYFIKYIDKVYDNLKKRFDEVYLLRNEKFFKIFDFDEGRPFEPDYVLFLLKRVPNEAVSYQVFLEPKGQNRFKEDAWKEKFLMGLKKEHRLEKLWADRKYVVWGMPFYNHEFNTSIFERSFGEFQGQKNEKPK